MNVFYLGNPFFNIHNTPSSSFQLTSTCLFLLLSSALFKYSNLPSTFFPSYPGAAHVFERSKLPAFQHFGTRFLYPTVMNCYATVTNPIRQLLALCDSYESYPTVISSMRQLWGLCDSYESYPTVTKKKSSMSLLGHRRLTGKQIFYAVDHDFPEIFYAFLMILRKKKTVKSNKKYHVYTEHWLK